MISSTTLRSSSLVTYLNTEGTPMRVSSALGSRPTCSSRLALLSRIQSGRWDLELAALHGERDLGGAAVAGDHVVLGARRFLVHVAVSAGGIAGRDPAEGRPLRERVVEGLDLRVLARDADARAVVGGAEIEHLGRVEQRLGLFVEQRAHHSPGMRAAM